MFLSSHQHRIAEDFSAATLSFGGMRLHDLPAVLVEDIIREATWTGELYAACRLREVNSMLHSAHIWNLTNSSGFFELVVTTSIARRWFCKFTQDEPKNMPDAFRRRLIKAFLGGQDRRMNPLQSHLHAVCDYLTECFPSHTRDHWLQMIQESLNCCELCDSWNYPLRLHDCIIPSGFDYNRIRIRNDEAVLAAPSLEAVCATSLMVAVLCGDEGLQRTLLGHGIDPNVQCFYLGYPLDMACRLGFLDTVKTLLAAGARDVVTGKTPHALMSAILSNQAHVVDMLLRLPEYPSSESYNLHCVAILAARTNSRRIFEILLEVDSDSCAIPATKVALLNGWDDILERLMQLGLYRPEAFAECSHTFGSALTHAARSGHLSTCQLVFAKTPRNHLRDGKVLVAAAVGGNVEILELIMREKMRIALEIHLPTVAAFNGRLEMLDYLLKHGYHLKHKHPQALLQYALIGAIYRQHNEIVQSLIPRIDFAAEPGYFQLKDQVADSLVFAVDSGNKQIVVLLISLGAIANRVPWDFISFIKQDRIDRYLTIERRATELELRPLARWTELKYKAHQRSVDEALEVVKSYCKIG
jgi:ankyrin repeat protein